MNVSENLHLLVSSGDGPRECRRAVSLVLKQMEREALDRGIRFGAEQSDAAGRDDDPSSAVVTLSGKDVAEIMARQSG